MKVDTNNPIEDENAANQDDGNESKSEDSSDEYYV